MQSATKNHRDDDILDRQHVNAGKRKRVISKSNCSLSFLLAMLQGNEVVIELKNDTEVRGFVEEASNKMDVQLCNCSQTNIDGQSIDMDRMIIKGKSIRFVHLPKSLSVTKTMNDFVRKMEYNDRRNAPNQIHDRKQKS